MTKVWLLYENPYDEGDNVFGAFSTKEKVNKAHEIFSKVSRYELYISEFELDALEEYFPIALEGYQWFSGGRQRSAWGDKVIYSDWDLTPNSIDSLFAKEDKNSVMVQDRSVFASIKARSVEEATEIAEKILQEKGEGYSEWLK